MSGTGCKCKHGAAIITRSRGRSQKRRGRGRRKGGRRKWKRSGAKMAKVMRLPLPLSSKNTDQKIKDLEMFWHEREKMWQHFRFYPFSGDSFMHFISTCLGPLKRTLTLTCFIYHRGIQRSAGTSFQAWTHSGKGWGWENAPWQDNDKSS